MLSLFQMPSTHTAQAPVLPTINNGQRAHSFPPARTHLIVCSVCVCVCYCAHGNLYVSVIALHVALLCSALLCCPASLFAGVTL